MAERTTAVGGGASLTPVTGLAARTRAAEIARVLVLRAGPRALALVRDRGLRPDDVDVLAGASGGAKWLVLAGLDRFLMGEFFGASRARPLHAIGSSIGSWRLACFAQRDRLAALARGHHAYIHEQRYSSRPTTREITAVLARVLDLMLGPTGVEELLAHPWLRVHVLVTRARGWGASDHRARLTAAILAAALGNALSRRSLAWRMERVVFHNGGAESPFRALRDLPTVDVALTPENTRAALMASGSIPLLVDPVRFPGSDAAYWDGGVLDYHPDVDFGAGDGLVLYPHFYPHVTPGWFDKGLPWRRASARNFSRALLIAPSPAWVATLPGAKIPDRKDFRALSDAERIARWTRAHAESERVADALREVLASGTIVEHVVPWK